MDKKGKKKKKGKDINKNNYIICGLTIVIYISYD